MALFFYSHLTSILISSPTALLVTGHALAEKIDAPTHVTDVTLVEGAATQTFKYEL